MRVPVLKAPSRSRQAGRDKPIITPLTARLSANGISPESFAIDLHRRWVHQYPQDMAMGSASG